MYWLLDGWIRTRTIWHTLRFSSESTSKNTVIGNAERLSASYPEDNCGVNGNYLNAQDIFYEWLNHTSATNLTVPYFDGTRQALAAGKEMIMFETNTASCGGFAGISDSFGATLW